MTALKTIFATVAFIVISACATIPAFSRNDTSPVSEWQGIETAEVRLVQGHAGQTDTATVSIGLEFVMSPGWKVYWRSPGDAGFPPIPDFTGSTNLTDHRVEWPMPKRFTYYGLQTFGYENRVVLPVMMRRRAAELATPIVLNLSYAACADICVPVTADLSITVPGGSQPENRHGRAIARALAKAPPRQNTAIRHISATHDADAVSVTIVAARPLRSPEVILEGPDTVAFGRPVCDTAAPVAKRITCAFPYQGRGRIKNGQPVEFTLTVANPTGWSAETAFTMPPTR